MVAAAQAAEQARRLTRAEMLQGARHWANRQYPGRKRWATDYLDWRRDKTQWYVTRRWLLITPVWDEDREEYESVMIPPAALTTHRGQRAAIRQGQIVGRTRYQRRRRLEQDRAAGRLREHYFSAY